MFVVAAPQHDYPLEHELVGVADGHARVRVVRDPGAWWGTGHVKGRWALDGTRACHVMYEQVDGDKRRARRGHVSRELLLSASTSAYFG